MKKAMMMLMLCVSMLSLFGENKTFNPENPGDPQSVAPRHPVTIDVFPSVGGRVSASNIYLEEGQQRNIYAYNNAGYHFAGWAQDSVIFSTRNPLCIQMGQDTLIYTAVFEFNPASPVDPDANDFNATTGELLVDRFESGSLSTAIQAVMNGRSYTQIKSATIIGRMSASDFGFTYDMTNCKVLDLSKTTGITEIPETAFNNMTALTTIILPPSVESIGNYAFYNCKELQEIVMYSAAPPTAADNLFSEINYKLKIRVPASSISLYERSEVYKQFTIVPIDAQAMTVNLPKDAADGRYQNMSLQVEDKETGQTWRYILTDRTAYVFANLFRNSQYRVTVQNSRGIVLGQMDEVMIGEEDVTVEFESLLQPMDVELKVLTDEGKDVTDKVKIRWMDAEGELLQNGALLTNQIENSVLQYSIVLDDDLLNTYETPKTEDITISKATTTITYKLQKLSAATISGSVVSANTLLPAKGIKITISQVLKGKKSNIYMTETDANGKFSIEIPRAKTTIYFTDNSSMKQTLSLEASELGEIGTIKMQPLEGAVLYIIPRYTESVRHDSKQDTISNYSDYANIDLLIYNETQQKQMEAVVQYPIITLPETIVLGDSLTITATSRNHKFNQTNAGVKIDSTLHARVILPITQLGSVNASYKQTEAEEVIALLFKQDGELAKKKIFNAQQEVQFEYLDDGEYIIVCLENLKPFSDISRLGELAASGLKEKSDYSLKLLTVSSGWISTAEFDNVSNISRALLYAGNSMRFTSTTTQVVIGDYITLKSQIDFKEEYEYSISDVQFVFDLPENTDFINGSVMVGGKVSKNYTLADGRLTIPIEDTKQQIAFCILPRQADNYSPCAYAQFTRANKKIQIPIASAYYEVKGLSLSVPNVFSTQTIKAGGTAIPNSTVEVYADEELIGTSRTQANGRWSAECSFRELRNLKIMKVYAIATEGNGKKHKSETVDCQYNQDAIEVSKVTMYHWNPEVNSWKGQMYEIVFDFQNPSHKPGNYIYYIYNKEFSFDVDFTSNDQTKISDVILSVKTGDGSWTKLGCNYNEEKGKWTAKGNFGEMYDGNIPVNVAVDFRQDITPKVDSKGIDEAYSELEKFKADFLSYDASVIDESTDIPTTDYSILIDSLNSLSEEEFEHWAEEWQAEMDELLLQVELMNLRLETEMQEVSIYRLDTIYVDDTNYIIYETSRIGNIKEQDLVKAGYTKIASTFNEGIYEKSDEMVFERIDFNRDIYTKISLSETAVQSIRRAPFDVRNIVSLENTGQSVRDGVIGELVEQGAGRAFLNQSERESFNKLNEKIAQNQEILKNSDPTGLSNLDKYSSKNLEKLTNETEKMLEQKEKLLSKGKFAGKILGAGWSAFNFATDNIGKYSSLNNIQQPVCDNPEFTNDIIAFNNDLQALRHDLNVHAGWQAARNAAYIGLSFVPGVGLAVGLALAVTEGLVEDCFEGQFNVDFRNRVAALQARSNNITRACRARGTQQNPTDEDEPEEDNEPEGEESGNPDATNTIDPAGYVYEAVSENRIEGVMATIYFKDTVRNEYGELAEQEIMWDAEEYDQENPLYTDENGEYQWFVPQGLWQVRFEKEGYEKTQSEWLPVPPPQLEVNIPIVQLRQPEVKSAHAYEMGVVVEFDKYMLPTTLTEENILLTANDEAINGKVVLLNEQQSYGDDATTYASRVRFVPDEKITAKQVTLTVSSRVSSYANIQMSETFTQTFDIEQEPQQPTKYLITFLQDDGTVLQADSVIAGEMPEYKLDTPTKASTEQYDYTFAGWQPEVVAATADATYTATYNSTPRQTELSNVYEEGRMPYKIVEEGHVYIVMPNGERYSVFGIKKE